MKILRVDPACHSLLASLPDLVNSTEFLTGRHEGPHGIFVDELHEPIEIVTEVDLFELLGKAFRVVLSVLGSQLALDGLHVEVFVDAVNLAVANMKDEAAEEVIVLPLGFELDRRKVCLIG